MIDYSLYVKSKEDIKKCNEIPYFCGYSIEIFSYLIDEYSFEKAEIEIKGREYQVIFKRENFVIKIVYEMGTLPEVYLLRNNRFVNLDEVSDEYKKLFNTEKYKLHNKIQEIINRPNISVSNYIKTLGSLWDDNKEEIIQEIKTYLHETSIFLKKENLLSRLQ